MQIIKPYGRTKTNVESRRIQPNAKARNTTCENGELEDINEFLQTHSDFFFAQWISILDKIFAKPAPPTNEQKKAFNGREERYQLQCPIDNITYQAREKLSQAFIKHWEEKRDGKCLMKMTEDNRKVWEYKLHPYTPLQNGKITRNGRVKKVGCKKVLKTTEIQIGKWYYVFTDQDPKPGNLRDEDYEIIAKSVYNHLYHAEKIKSSKSATEKRTKKHGLIYNKANGISQNIRKIHSDVSDLSDGFLSRAEKRYVERLQSKLIDWEKHKEPYNLSDLTTSLKEKENGDNKIDYYDAIACINNHYRNVFIDKAGKSLSVNEAKDQHPELWTYHLIVKDALHWRYPKKRKNLQKPISEDLLHSLAIDREKNRILSFAIRLGKVVHYEASQQRENQENAQTVLDFVCSDSQKVILESQYWQSEGQTIIKQKESFVRQWLNAISAANSTMVRLIDPNNLLESVLDKLPDEERKNTTHGKIDYFSQNTVNDVIKYILVTEDGKKAFDEQCKLVFGENHGLYGANYVSCELFIRALREAIAGLRNATFHFKDISEFKAKLNPIGEEGYKNSTKCVEALVEKHLSINRDLLNKRFESTRAPEYLGQFQFEQIYNAVIGNDKDTMPLPKFNNLLVKAPNIKKSLIEAPTEILMKDKGSSYHCQHTCLKLLYERDFPKWLKTQDAAKWIKSAKDRINTETRNLNQDSPVESKVARLVSKLGSNGKKTDILEYIQYLTRETAQEAQVIQGMYKHDKKNAREQANFLEGFKQDIFIFAFHDYLQQKDIEFLLVSLTLHAVTYNLEEITAGVKDNKNFGRPWLYIILNLIPIEYVNHLALSLRKLTTLTIGESEAHTEEYKDVYQAISLYLDMHDVNLGVNHLTDEDAIFKFFEPEARIHIYESGNIKPIKGLREVLRFGNLDQLATICDGYKVSKSDFNAIEKLINPGSDRKKNIRLSGFADLGAALNDKSVSDAQEKLKQFNEEKKRGGIKRINTDDYKKHLGIITEHRELKNKIQLVDHKKIHQLMKAVSGRLLGFSQIWERDIYFVLLALVFINKADTDPESFDHIKGFIRSGRMVDVWRNLKDSDENGQKTIKENLSVMLAINKKKIIIRNDLAHFNKIRATSETGIDLTELINQARYLMQYDRKLKNSVSKSMRELLDRNNIIAKFKMTNHELSLDSMEAKSIQHLGNKNVNEALLSKGYVNTVKKMFKP